MFLLIDNFDSFTYNLVQEFQKQGRDPVVVKNDRPRLLEMAESPDLEMVCISPGPSHPQNAGLCLEFLARLPKTVPVLGVCLGHQVLGHFAGLPVEVAGRIMHGKTSRVSHSGGGLFAGVDQDFEVCRYHSLLVMAGDGNDLVEVTARTGEDEVMGLTYKDRPWVGVQFHPESILTPQGPRLLANFPTALQRDGDAGGTG